MASLPDYQEIEDAYKVVRELIQDLPKSTESERAKANLEIAQKLTYEARERSKGAE